MKVKLIPGPRDEAMIALVRETLNECSHESGTCKGCSRCSKYDCDLMVLCNMYGHDKIYDAIYYAYNGNEQTLHDIEAFEWETMTQESWNIYINWLSDRKLMD